MQETNRLTTLQIVPCTQIFTVLTKVNERTTVNAPVLLKNNKQESNPIHRQTCF